MSSRQSVVWLLILSEQNSQIYNLQWYGTEKQRLLKF